jgi:hypothetical protein
VLIGAMRGSEMRTTVSIGDERKSRTAIFAEKEDEALALLLFFYFI